jgi:hypothetical protein
VAKGYNLTPDYVLYKMSYANTILYGSVLLSGDEETKKSGEKLINADDPKNRDEIRKELYG